MVKLEVQIRRQVTTTVKSARDRGERKWWRLSTVHFRGRFFTCAPGCPTASPSSLSCSCKGLEDSGTVMEGSGNGVEGWGHTRSSVPLLQNSGSGRTGTVVVHPTNLMAWSELVAQNQWVSSCRQPSGTWRVLSHSTPSLSWSRMQKSTCKESEIQRHSGWTEVHLSKTALGKNNVSDIAKRAFPLSESRRATKSRTKHIFGIEVNREATLLTLQAKRARNVELTEKFVNWKRDWRKRRLQHHF